MNYIAVSFGQKILSSLGEVDQEQKKILGSLNYIREYRYFSVRLPRRTGKTTYLANHHKSTSSLMFVMDHYHAKDLESDSVISIGSIYTLMNIYRGRYSQGLKYQCFIFDECVPSNQQLYDLLNVMNKSNMLTDDFYIISMSTI